MSARLPSVRVATLIAGICAAVVVGISAAAIISAGQGIRPSPGSSSAPTLTVSPSTSDEPTLTPLPSSELPPDVRNLPWVASDGTGYVAGTLGTGPTITLPADEVGLDADGQLVLTIDEPTRMAVTIRDVLTAEITRQYETTFLVDQGLLKDDRVYLAGRSEDGEHDGGVWWAMAGESAAFEPLIAPVIDPAPGAGMWTRLPLVVSPSGSTLGTTVCVQSGCFTQLVDTTSGIVSTIEDAYLSWLSDTTAVLIDGKELRAYSVADSAATWELTTQGDYYGGFFLADEATLIETSTEDGGDDYRYEIAAIAGESGDRVVILALEDPELSDYRLIPALSTHRYAVLLSDFTVEAALGSGDPEIVRIVDLETGALLPDLFVFVTE